MRLGSYIYFLALGGGEIIFPSDIELSFCPLIIQSVIKSVFIFSSPLSVGGLMETVGNTEAFALTKFLPCCLFTYLGQKRCPTQALCPVAIVTVEEESPVLSF